MLFHCFIFNAQPLRRSSKCPCEFSSSPGGGQGLHLPEIDKQDSTVWGWESYLPGIYKNDIASIIHIHSFRGQKQQYLLGPYCA